MSIAMHKTDTKTILGYTSEKVALWLMLLFTFSLPMSVAINNIFAALIFLFWLYRGSYLYTWKLIKTSKVLQAFLLFFILHIIGLLWTEDIKWGLHILKKEWMFLFAPILFSFVKREYLYQYLSAFLAAMTISEILSYLIWLHILPPILHATAFDPTPFMHHTSYNPLLSVAIYIIGYLILLDKDTFVKHKIFLIFFFITMSINMFITGGRAGQMAYAVVVTVLLFQYFHKSVIKSIFISSIAIGTIFSLAYLGSSIFQQRVHMAIDEVQNYKAEANTSVGLRLTFVDNTWKLIKAHPVIGVGTGDFKNEYNKVNEACTPKALSTCQPHNMYLLVLAQFGVLGLLVFLYIFYAQIQHARQNKHNIEKKIGLMLPIVFSVIMLSDAYLLGHFTTVLFVLFSALLYQPNSESHA